MAVDIGTLIDVTQVASIVAEGWPWWDGGVSVPQDVPPVIDVVDPLEPEVQEAGLRTCAERFTPPQMLAMLYIEDVARLPEEQEKLEFIAEFHSNPEIQAAARAILSMGAEHYDPCQHVTGATVH